MDTKVIKNVGLLKKDRKCRGNEEVNRFILPDMFLSQWPDTGDDGENFSHAVLSNFRELQ